MVRSDRGLAGRREAPRVLWLAGWLATIRWLSPSSSPWEEPLRLAEHALERGRREEALDALHLAGQELARAEAGGADGVGIGRGARALAERYLGLRLPAAARDLLARAVVALERGGASGAERAEALRDQAVAITHCGELAPAEALLLRALDLQERVLGPEHPELGRTLATLAEVLRLGGRLREADPLLRRALALQEAALGPDHPLVGKTLALLALLEKEHGRPERALGLLERAIEIEDTAGSPDLLATLATLAGVQDALGEPGHAARTLERLLVLLERVHGPDHADLLPALDHLAAIRARQGRLEEGQALYRRTLALREAALGEDHADVAASLSDLAGVLLRQGRGGEAAVLLERALAIWEVRLGPDHEQVARARAALHQAHRAPAPGGPTLGAEARLELLAWVGDPRARATLGPSAPALPDELDLWIAGLLRFGAPLLVRALVAAAEVALPELTRRRPTDTRPLQALMAARAWRDAPGRDLAQVVAGTSLGAGNAAEDAEHPAAASAGWAVQRLTLAVVAAERGDEARVLELGQEAVEAAARATGPATVTGAIARALRGWAGEERASAP